MNMKAGLPKLTGMAGREYFERFCEQAGHYIRSKHPQRKIWAVFRHTLLIGVGFVIMYSILYMISNAFRPPEENFDPSVIWIPKSPTLSNFRDALEVLNINELLGNTLAVTLGTTLIQVVVCLLVGYGFARFRFKGCKILFGLVILTIIVPPQNLSTSLYSNFRYFDFLGILRYLEKVTDGAVKPINLIGTYWVSWLPALTGTGLRSGLYIYMYRQYFIGIPKELEEASAIDGCGPYSTFARIMLPNTKNIVITVFLFSIVWNWNDFYTPAMYMQNMPTLARALSEFQSNLQMIASIGGANMDPIVVLTRIQAACLLAILPLLILYIFTQRYFTESIENTGITGI